MQLLQWAPSVVIRSKIAARHYHLREHCDSKSDLGFAMSRLVNNNNRGSGMKKVIVILIALLSSIILTLYTGLNAKSGNIITGASEYLVLRVIDGDTIEVEKLGKVRYIGVDSPEISRGPEPFGMEAWEVNRQLVEGKKVRLELDVGERDRYGRVLAYVFVGDTFVNAWLVEHGYSRVMTIPPNVKYAELFLKLEREAREYGRGLWGAPENKRSKAIAGYRSSSKSNKFHRSSCRWAQRISPQNLVIFESREEARKAGYEPCKECKP